MSKPMVKSVFALLLMITSTISMAQDRVIYGADDRLDLYQVDGTVWKDLAQSTAALVYKDRLQKSGISEFMLKTDQFGSSYNLCKSEPFREQPTSAYCSGFLVGTDTLVTAGHCISGQYDCRETAFVFGFGMHQPGMVPTVYSNDDVYYCKKIVHTIAQGNGKDFAVIKLDRKVKGIKPLSFRKTGKIEKDKEIVVIGHPAGLPTKVAGGASVRKSGSDFFVANLDTYGGNSGSAVFNAQTLDVEGILVRGEVDFDYVNNCRISHRCKDDGCRGEDVTSISNITPYVK